MTRDLTRNKCAPPQREGNTTGTVVFPPISAEKVDIARCCAPRQKNANNARSDILLQKKVGAIDKRNEHVISRCETGGFYRSWS